MTTTRWVQHILNKEGEKWAVLGELPVQWIVQQGEGMIPSILPKLEYRLCDPPEQWEDVTDSYKSLDGAGTASLLVDERFSYIDGMHHGPAFIVERKVS